MTISNACSIVKLIILNQPYEIKCPDSEIQHLEKAADILNAHALKTKQKFKHLDNFQTLLLAALNVGHDLVLCRQQHDEQRKKIAEFMTVLEEQDLTDIKK
ncbi:MAG: cell division protein ZapA [Legionella sp.]|nr:cell division protein ZapA [Legionella sp.]